MDLNLGKPLILCMVGLPARGKSYISRKIARFLTWSGLKAKVFNIGNYRRTLVGVDMDFEKFFDHTNKEYNKKRDECAIEAMKDMTEHIKSRRVDVAILDGTNSTYQRRLLIDDYLKQTMNMEFSLIWIESICTLSDIIENNIKETKLKSDDYKKWDDKDKAIQDFKRRISQYEEVYQTINQKEETGITNMKFIKLINQGRNIVMDNIYGYLESKLISYIINLHTGQRAIYFSRHGESVFNTKELIGGNSSLSENGAKYAEGLAKYFDQEFADLPSDSNNFPKLFCSTLKRAMETSQIIIDKGKVFKTFSSQKTLDEISTGLRDGMTYEEIKEKYPKEYEERTRDKLNYRYPRGESYMDVIRRIEPMIFELERSRKPLVVIGHQAMLRCLYGYFNNTPIDSIPLLDIPLHVVIKFIPKDYGFYEERYYIDHKTGNISKLENNTINIE